MVLEKSFWIDSEELNLNLVSSSIEADVTLNLTVTNEKIVVGFCAGRPELESEQAWIGITDSEDKPIQPVEN